MPGFDYVSFHFWENSNIRQDRHSQILLQLSYIRHTSKTVIFRLFYDYQILQRYLFSDSCKIVLCKTHTKTGRQVFSVETESLSLSYFRQF